MFLSFFIPRNVLKAYKAGSAAASYAMMQQCKTYLFLGIACVPNIW